MYNYKKIMNKLHKFQNDIYSPSTGDILIGQYTQDIIPMGFNETFIELQQENNTLYIEKDPSLTHALTKANASVGDHIAIKVGKQHNFTKWSIKSYHFHVIKVQKVNGEYE